MSYPFDLQIAWWVLVGVLLIGYAILDGFDLGVGILYLFSKTDQQRRILLNAIGPVWDGNEVWLIVGGGALFAAFPDVYATVFSGFYTPFMLLLTALIFRAVAIEFRSKRESPKWRARWDASFSVASLLIALLTGVALGNIALGIPLDAQHEYVGGFFNLLNPYALIMGITTVALFSLHGAIYTVLKTEGELQEMAKMWMFGCVIFFAFFYIVLTMSTFLFVPHMVENFRTNPALLVVPFTHLLVLFNIPREIYRRREMSAFFMSSLNIALLLVLFGIG
ncbi:MAG: cytochrome d ubiquinol oxidase subunit II, partial [Fimbriimonadaceae bacterium]